MSQRQERKLDHVRLAALGAAAVLVWADVHLVHQSLPEMGLAEIDLTTRLAGKRLGAPVIINAMTGGAFGVEQINRDLAVVAAELGLAMAVGSQTAGIREPEVAGTYRVVRETNPKGVLIGNVGAGGSVDDARRAVEMIGADILQIHLNAPQELVMPEGDRDFRGQLDAIAAIVQALPVPVIVKECGFGLSRETVRRLHEVGVRTVDVSGWGGTNFVAIEAGRAETADLDPGLAKWGIPTPCAVAEVAAMGLPGLSIIASGGVRYGSDSAKALALGADAVGVAGAVLKAWKAGGVSGALRFMENLLTDLKRCMLLVGAHTPAALREVPVVLTGMTAQWCALRGVDVEALASRAR